MVLQLPALPSQAVRVGKSWQQGPAHFPAPGNLLPSRPAAHFCQALEPGLPQDIPGFGTV